MGDGRRLDDAGLDALALVDGAVLVVGRRDGVVTWANPAAQAALAPGGAALAGQPLAGLVGADATLAQQLQALADAPARWPADGGVARMTLAPAQHDGAPVAVVTLHDTDRPDCAHAARLNAAERLLKLGAWSYTPASGQLEWAPRVFDMLRLDPAQGVPAFDAYLELVHPDDRAAVEDSHARFDDDSTPEVVFQHRVMRPDGTVAVVRGVGERQHHPDGTRLVGVVQEITEQEEMRSRLSETVRLLRMAGAVARLGGWRYDRATGRLHLSAEMVALYHAPDQRTPGLDAALAHYTPEHRDRVRAAFDACLHDGTPFDEIAQIAHGDGKRVWVRTLGEPLHDADGIIVGAQGALQDISDLIAARDRAATLAQQLHQTLDTINDGFILLDDADCLRFVNARAETLLDHDRGALLGRRMWDAFPDAVGSTFDAEIRAARAQNTTRRFDEVFKARDMTLEVDAHPTPDGLAIYFRDVTAERARDEHLRLLDAAVARQTDMLVITEAEPIDAPDGPRIVYVNDAYLAHTGYTRDEVIGATPRILQGEGTDRAELDRIRAAMERWQPSRSELLNYTRDGTPFWLELDIVPLADADGWYTHWVSVQRDVTARKAAEDAIAASERRFRLVAHATRSAIWDWDITAGTQWWSEGLTTTFGHPTDPAERVPTVWQASIHADDAARVAAAADRLRSGAEDGYHETYRVWRGDGGLATVEDRAFAVRGADGRVVRVMGSVTDTTETRAIEEQLHQAQKLEAVGQLTGGVAHDFNNILTVILGNAEMLTDALDPQPDLKRMAAMTAASAQRGAELTSRLLAFSRRQPLEPRVIDVSNLIANMEYLLRHSLGEDIDIEVVRAGGLWRAEVDPGQLETALLNLAINARDAMNGAGKLTIETANAALDADYAAATFDVAPGQYVTVTVSDTGPGMPPDVRARAFEPFFTTKGSGQGSGLGLSMVFGFVKQTGGHVRIYSEPGEGTAVKLYLPRARRATPAEPAPRRTAARAGGDEAVLVVEDDTLVRDHLVGQLHALGYTVMDAADGPQALAWLDTDARVDLLFTDVVMPGGLNGRELAREARARRPGLKVLFTSGYTENTIIHQGRLDPDVTLLSKPYRRDQLAAKLRAVLDGE